MNKKKEAVRALGRRVPILAAMVLSAMAMACYTPHFDEGLSLSVSFAKKLDHVSSLGPFYMDDSVYQDGYFLPDRIPAPLDGYWITAREGYLSARYMNSSSMYNPQSTYGNTFGSNAVTYTLSAATASPGLSSVGKGLATIFASDLNGGVIAIGTDGSFNFTGNSPLAAAVAIPLPPPYYLVGASYYIMSTNNSLDSVSLLYASDVSGYEVSGLTFTITNLNSSELPQIGQSGNVANSNCPRLEPGAYFACNNLLSRFYLSGTKSPDGGTYSAYWDLASFVAGGAPIEMPDVKARICTILSNGELLSSDGTTMPLYDSTGNLESTLFTGSLRFAFEYLDGADFYCYFTRAVRVREGHDSRILVDVWRCKTSELRSFGN